MGAPSFPRFLGERAIRRQQDDVCRTFAEQASRSGAKSSGHHNQNYVLALTEQMARVVGREPGTSVTVRVRRAEVLPVVIRTWPNEAEILQAVRGALPHAPECLLQREDFAIHSYVEGVPLSGVCGNGKPVDPLLVEAMAQLLARMTQVRREALPKLPEGWPRKGSRSFLQTLAHLADGQIRQPNWAEFGGLFASLGVPDDALTRFAERVPAMARRPYSLLHADLHRDNLIVSYGGQPPLICVDWELATYGDPLHDLATHLVRMRYPEYQEAEVIEAWATAMGHVRPAAVNGLDRDLRRYLAFERAQSLYPDVMRAARSLQQSFSPKALDDATAAVDRALRHAAEPLGLRVLPTEADIERVLFRWQSSRLNGRAGTGRYVAVGWERDRRFQARDEFPDRAVSDALLAEGRAPAHRVFKGTGHLNTVVRVPGSDRAVVVRRKADDACRRERSFLSEHAVLGAIEAANVPVAVPRVLALGESYQHEPFAVHTYVGPQDANEPPDHPVNGLRLHEADALVDQLCALTRVDYRQLDPAPAEENWSFFPWLCDQLVRLVDGLPKSSQQLARMLGLPDSERLRLILSRHVVTDRSPALLHGDLNPWNLVRRPDELALTVIDWEMAMVGDPLYDLVRHMHLTPTRSEIRERMFRRWARSLPSSHTEGWARDWHVYRGIEIVRSAYVDLDRLVTRSSLDAPNVRRALEGYAMTLAAASASLGLPIRATANPYLARALA
ncbi:phosphotransferase [Streptomyces sp. NPDC008150]|uniref:phosphotransferase family protein n=1 Tax=Streptomyces sp. NPDC008150 TaxID=3364816 RepID=UPI0036E5F59A